uniref:DNA-binding protein n=1 Tax=Strongyloides venezuelensis TaxID=75913 RepID=A0A0K0FW77_STRVS
MKTNTKSRGIRESVEETDDVISLQKRAAPTGKPKPQLRNGGKTRTTKYPPGHPSRKTPRPRPGVKPGAKPAPKPAPKSRA